MERTHCRICGSRLRVVALVEERQKRATVRVICKGDDGTGHHVNLVKLDKPRR